MRFDSLDLIRVQGDQWYERGLLLAAFEARQQWYQSARQWAPDHLPAALNALGSVYIELGKVAEAIPLFNQVLDLSTMSVSVDQVRAVSNLSLCHYLLGEIDACIARGERARRMFVGLDDPDISVGAHVDLVLGLGYIAADRWDEALDAHERALESAKALGDQKGISSILNNMGCIYVEMGRCDLAEDYLSRSLELMETAGQVESTGYTLTELGQVYFRRGDLATALRYGNRALDVLWSNMGLIDKAEVARLCELFGSISEATGDRKGAVNYLQRAITYYAQRGLWREWSHATKKLDLIVAKRPGGVWDVDQTWVNREDHRRLRYLTTLLDLMDTLESLYPERQGIAELVTRYALAIGRACGISGPDINSLSHAARLHNIGWTTVSETEVSIEDDRQEVLTPLLGERVLRTFDICVTVRAAVKHYRERYDGNGCPDGLKGEEIPIFSRIIGLAEGYVNAVFRDPRPQEAHSRALEAIKARSGSRYDPALVDVFVAQHAL